METAWEYLIWLIVLGVTVGIVLGTATSFVKIGFNYWKYIALFGLVIWIVKTWA